MERKPPMTESEATEFVASMRKGTRPAVAKHFLQIALGPMGNLSEEARVVYRRELKRLKDI